jgi:hypothetical protein
MQGVPEKAKWCFLLGNTMLRMLGHVELTGGLMQHWQSLTVGAILMTTSAKARAGVPGPDYAGASTADVQAAYDGVPNKGPVIFTAEAHAAVEVLMIMLPEFCMRQAPSLTCRKLAEWESGRAGETKQAIAALELRHAHAIGIELELF